MSNPSHLRRLLSLTSLTALLSACFSSTPIPERVAADVFPDLPTVGAVTLAQTAATPPEYQLLDIGIAAFENVHHDEDSDLYGDWIFSEIRDNERHFLPFVLRNTLLASNQWGRFACCLCWILPSICL